MSYADTVNADSPVVYLLGTLSLPATATPAGLPTGPTDPFSVEFWHRGATYTALAQVFGFGPDPLAPGAGEHRHTLQFGDNYYFWGASHDWDSGVPWRYDADWHHVVWTSDGATLSLYVDGAFAASTGLPAFNAAGTIVTAGSHHPAGSDPVVDVRDGAVYAACLTGTRILAHYDAAFAPAAVVARRSVSARAGSRGVAA